MKTLFNANVGNMKTYLFQDYMVNINIYTARLCREGENFNSKICSLKINAFQYSVQNDVSLA